MIERCSYCNHEPGPIQVSLGAFPPESPMLKAYRNLGYRVTENYVFNPKAFAERQKINNRLYPSRIQIVESNKIEPGTLLMVDYQGVVDELHKGKTLAEAVVGHCFKIENLEI